MSAYGSHSVSCIGDYLPGAHYHGLTIKLVPDFVDHLQQSAVSKDCSMFSTGSDPFPKNAVTPSMIRILHEIVRCDYKENIKEIYLEGKVLELTAMYLNDVIGKPSVSLALTRTDVDSLMKAKEILDTDLLSPPSLSQLSRLVCLNDFKLKRGFKQLFGLSVHAYVIDRRLEAAYHLLEEGSVTITMAAALSGFNKPSHFAEKFRQKYGASPSQYFRKLR
ncbi:Regulatory protein PchR [compost metagenome]